MTAERDPMTLNESTVPALWVEERSDEAPRAGRARPTPDPEVVAKPKRRQFTAQWRRWNRSRWQIPHCHRAVRTHREPR